MADPTLTLLCRFNRGRGHQPIGLIQMTEKCPVCNDHGYYTVPCDFNGPYEVPCRDCNPSAFKARGGYNHVVVS